MDFPILSILCLTIPSRANLWEVLKAEIENQAKGYPVEFLWHLDDSVDPNRVPIGVNRQMLLEKATGKYIVFIDDDDFIDLAYVKNIIKAAEDDSDTIGYLIACDITDGNGNREKSTAIVSYRYEDWYENKDGYRYAQSTYHKNPVKREIALKVGFPPKPFAEDYAYSMGIKRYLKSETFINHPMYYYRHVWSEPKKRYGIK